MSATAAAPDNGASNGAVTDVLDTPWAPRSLGMMCRILMSQSEVAPRGFSVSTMTYFELREAAWRLLSNVTDAWTVLAGLCRIPELVGVLTRKTIDSVPAKTCLSLWHFLCTVARFYVMAQLGMPQMFEHAVNLAELSIFDPTVSDRAFLRCGTIFAALSMRVGGVKDNPLISLLFTTSELVLLSTTVLGGYFSTTIRSQVTRVQVTGFEDGLEVVVIQCFNNALSRATYSTNFPRTVAYFMATVGTFIEDTRRMLFTVCELLLQNNIVVFCTSNYMSPDVGIYRLPTHYETRSFKCSSRREHIKRLLLSLGVGRHCYNLG
jgi:hypothetical protein